MESIQLHERTVTIGGYEYDDGNIRHVVGRRTIRIREYTDAQVELRFMIGVIVGLAIGILPTLIGMFLRPLLPI